MKVEVSGGSSGGPALNSAEQVIGIHISSGKYYAYSIPSNVLKALIVQSGSTEPLVEWHNPSPYSCLCLPQPGMAGTQIQSLL